MCLSKSCLHDKTGLLLFFQKFHLLGYICHVGYFREHI